MRGGFVGRLSSGQEEQFRLTKLDRKTRRMLLGYLRPHLFILLGALMAMMVVTASTLAIPYLTKVAIDDFIAARNLQGLNWIAFAFISLQGIYWFSAYWQSYLSSLVGQRIIYSLRRDLFDKLMAFSMDFYDDEKVGQVTSRITHDVNTLSDAMSSGIINFTNDTLTLAGMMVIMVWLHPTLALVTFVTAPLIVLTMWTLGRKLRAAYQQVREKAADLNAEVEESMAGIRVIQSLSQESASVGRFSTFNLGNLRANLKAVFLFAMVFPAMTVLGTVGSALVLVYGGMLVVQGSITLGVLMAFLGYVSRFFGPLRELSQVMNTFQAAGAGIERVFSYLQQQPTVQETKTPQCPDTGFLGEIQFSSVSFGYGQERKPVLEQFDLHIPAGETLAIVGPTGAGKSTIARLLSRFYDVNQGSICVDGIDIRSLSFADLRRTVTQVPQHTFLFDGTLAENIAYGQEGADDEQVEQALETVQGAHLLSQLKNGLQTQVGEGGVKLSGGQKQLVSFARAVLADPKILILDEATSSVDAYTESLIQQGLDRLLAGRTCIIIAHRFSTVQKADRICVLENGRISAEGTHDMLMAESNVYRSLYENQGKNTCHDS